MLFYNTTIDILFVLGFVKSSNQVDKSNEREGAVCVWNN